MGQLQIIGETVNVADEAQAVRADSNARISPIIANKVKVGDRGHATIQVHTMGHLDHTNSCIEVADERPSVRSNGDGSFMADIAGAVNDGRAGRCASLVQALATFRLPLFQS